MPRAGLNTDVTVTEERIDPAIVKLAVVLLVGVMAVQFDTTIVNVAIHRLVVDLHASVASTQWVVTAFVLALALVVPVSGWAMRRFGAKQVWLASLSLFGIGSVLCSVSWSLGSLIGFRVLQGAGGGLMLPILQTLLVRAAGGRGLGKLMGIVSLPLVLGPILGPVLGGLIVSHLSWRWIFWVNLPLCAAGLVLAWRRLSPTRPDRDAPRLDVGGLTLLSPALAAVIYGLSELGTHAGIDDPSVIVPLALGATLLAVFAAHGLRTRARPVIDLRLFSSRPFSAASALLFLFGLSLYGAMLLLPLYYQQVRGASALIAGALLAPQGLGMLLTRSKAGALTDRLGARPVALAGFALAALGSIAYTQVSPDTSIVLLAVSLVIRGAGLGAITIPVMAAAYQGVASQRTADASSATRIIMQIGGSFGTAVLAIILQTQITTHAHGGPAGLAPAFAATFWWSLGLTALAVLPALALPSRRRAKTRPAPAVRLGGGGRA
jgi:EmrB/QacA subfamily drug resistance transporter